MRRYRLTLSHVLISVVTVLACTDSQERGDFVENEDTSPMSNDGRFEGERGTLELDGFMTVDLDVLDDGIDAYTPIERDAADKPADTADRGGLWDSLLSPDAADIMTTSDMGDSCQIDENACGALSSHWQGNASRYPIVLVHGFMGWDRRWWLDYFYDIPQTLNASGFSVFVAELDPVASSEIRSAQLLRFVDDVRRCRCADKVNLIGHSQGGLDARMLIGPLDRAESVSSITTISSPHLGFQLADDVIANRGLGPAFLDALAVVTSTLFLGRADEEADFRATLNSMSVATRTSYNENYPDVASVPIYSYAGFTGLLSDGGPICEMGERPPPSRGDVVEPALLAMYGILGGPRRANDGIVPTAACVWGRFMGCVAADHFDQIGQVAGLSDRFDFRQFYREHATFLVGEGH